MDIVTAYGNRGDLLINRSLIQNLRRLGSVKVSTRNTPIEFLNKLELGEQEKCDSTNSIFFRLRRRNDVYFVATPGQNHGDASQILPALTGLLKTLLVRSLLRGRFIKVGVSLGPLHRAVVKIDKAKSYLYSLFGVRDNDSLLLCKNSKVRYFPDLAFISEDLLEARKNNNEDYYFISFRDHLLPNTPEHEYIESIGKKLMAFFEQRPNSNAIVAFHVPTDKRACEYLYNTLREVDLLNVQFVDRVLELEDSIRYASSAKCTISNRLHILLPALVTGTPHIALTNRKRHSKVESLYKSINAEFVLFDTNSDEEIQISSQNSAETLIEISNKQMRMALRLLEDSVSR